MIDRFDYEEQFHHERSRKEGKQSRRIAQKTDRSQFKKTDQKAPVKREPPENSQAGRIISITGEGILVDVQGQEHLCSIKGLLKKEITQSKNLLAVGDIVYLQQGAIIDVAERKSELARLDISGHKLQLIATNIDMVLITISVVSPPLKPALIDRYLIAARKGRMEGVVVVNKIDLLHHPGLEQEQEEYKEFLSAYEQAGIPIISVSAHTRCGIDALHTLMQGKTSVFSGQSGVGKTSLINATLGLHLKIGELTEKTMKGSHTTTTAKLIPIQNNGFVVDTPGIRSFGLWDLHMQDLTTHFHEITKAARFCKYADCSHINQPHCALPGALETGEVSHLRFSSWATLREEILE